MRSTRARLTGKISAMGEMKRIVTERYPVDKLPEELRRGLEGAQIVRVTVEGDLKPEAAAPAPSLMSYFGSGRGCYSTAEAVDYIRMLRDES